jgi:hypothetical protein
MGLLIYEQSSGFSLQEDENAVTTNNEDVDGRVLLLIS